MKSFAKSRNNALIVACFVIAIGKVQAFSPTKLSFSLVKPAVRCSFPDNQHISMQSKLNALPMHSMITDSATSLLLSDDIQAIAGANSALAGLRTFFITITALVFGFAGLTYFIAAVIVPKAADQLERDTKRLRPGLWEEYEAKLGEGETLATRPDLLQELGNIMQPLIIKDFEKSAEAKASDTAVDVEVINKPKSRLGDDNQWDD
jgi:hypothetical protein